MRLGSRLVGRPVTGLSKIRKCQAVCSSTLFGINTRIFLLIDLNKLAAEINPDVKLPSISSAVCLTASHDSLNIQNKKVEPTGWDENLTALRARYEGGGLGGARMVGCRKRKGGGEWGSTNGAWGYQGKL